MKTGLHRSLLFLLLIFLSLEVQAQTPVANFSANPQSSCSPLIVQFTDLSTNTPSSWSWNLGNGTTSTLKNPTTTYTTPGTYTITLTVTNASGTDTKTQTNFITVAPAPSVNFRAVDSTIACGAKVVQVQNLSALNATGTGSYFWDFGDGNTSTAQNPLSHTYSTPGTYSISLVVSNSAGCVQSLSKANYITVLPKPVASFAIPSTNACAAPFTASFSNNSTGAVSYLWDFGDGSTSTAVSPTHAYVSSGSYTVRLIATGANGCKDTAIVPGLINIGTIAASFSPSATTVCTGNPVTFTNTSLPGGAGSVWNFGDGTTSSQISPTHVYNTPGTYTVKLSLAYSTCSDSITSTITVLSGPTPAFTASPLVGCSAPMTVNFTNSSSGASSYTWIFGDGSATSSSTNPTHVYNSLGSYTVQLIAVSSNGCRDTLTKPAYVVMEAPGASLNTPPFLGCAPAPASFNVNVKSVVPVASYSWNFGDGSTGTGGPGASHTYSSPGTYTVTVTMQTTTGCVFTASQNVIVGSHTSPTFSATPTSICKNNPVTFSNSSTGSVTSQLWLFGDGQTSTQQNPTNFYSAEGIYTVRLITFNNGCADTAVLANYITVFPPTAQFKDSFPCSNRLQYYFKNTSTGATSYYWDFGDGSTSTTASPGHTYATYGTYKVMLAVKSTVTGCVDTTYTTLKLYKLSADFSAKDTAICRNGTTTFSPQNVSYAYYEWSWTGTNFYKYGLYPDPTYQYLGRFDAQLIVKDDRGCADTVTKLNYINVHAPTPNFTLSPSTGCSQLLVTFTDLSTASAGKSIISRTWDFGDGTSLTTTAATVSHLYSKPGLSTVTLRVTETGGCSEEISKVNVINVIRPTAAFSALNTKACLGKVTQFLNGSSSAGSLSYIWDFGDGSTSTLTNPGHVYATTGKYTVRLIAIDAGGCRDTLTRTNYIDVSSVVARFGLSDSTAPCPPFTVSFFDSSVNAVNYAWSFGNGGTSALQNPAAAYLSPGTFNVRLIVSNASGCTDTAQHTVKIGTGPTGTFSYSPINGCSPLQITFNGSSAGSSSLTYDFGNGAVSTTNVTMGSVNYTYVLPGKYRPTLILSDSNGCSTFILGPDTISVNKANAGYTFSASNGGACVGVPVQFNDTSTAALSGISNRSWSFGDGSTSTGTNPTHIYATAGTYQASLIVGTSNGCYDTIIKTVVIHPLPVVTAANQTVCGNQSVQLTASGAASYSWSPAAGLSCTNCASPTASPTVTTTYTITGTSSFGCIDSGRVTVTVSPSPVVNAGADQTICSGSSATLTATGAANYVWSPSAGLNATTGSSVSAAPGSTTTYTVIGTTAAGCSDTDQVLVTVNPIPVLSVTPSQSICAGSSATLTASGASTYSWTPATGLSATTTASVTASPSATTTYTVTGSSNGCNAQVNTTITVNPVPSVQVSGTNVLCAGASSTLTATGAGSYSWSPSAGLNSSTGASVIAQPAATTTYTVTGSSSNGCTGTATITITVHQLPIVTAGSDTSLCAGKSVPLTASGAANYSWSPAAGLSASNVASPTATPSSTTVYVVTGTDANNCSNKDSVVVTVNPVPVLVLSPNTSVCPGGSANLTASGADSYSWTPSTDLSCSNCANPVSTPGATITYTVIGGNRAGCYDTAQVTVAVNSSPTVSVSGTKTICIGKSTTLTASGANSFSWSPATGLSATTGSNVVAQPTATTTYTVIGTSGTGCSDTTTVTVTVNALPIVDAGIDTSLCIGGSMTLNASGASTYSWTPSTGLSSTTTASPVANPTATSKYVVAGTDANGCVNYDSILVTVHPLPVVATSGNTSVCPGGTASLSASGANSYSWTPATTLSCSNCSTPDATPAVTTTYVVTGTSAFGCIDTAQVTVSVNGTPTVTISGTTSVCVGKSTTLTASGANSFSWSPSTGLSAITGTTVVAQPTTTTTYTVIGTSGAGCSDTTTVTVTVNALPIVDAGIDTSLCIGGSMTLNASGASTYSWTPSTGLSSTSVASPVANPTATSKYVVTGTDANGCVNYDSILVTVNPLPVVATSGNTSVCPGGTASLSASGASTYSWTPATTLSCSNCSNPDATPAVTTTYFVTGTSTFGCIDTAQVTVSVNGTPTVTISGTTSVCIGKSTTLTASGANSFSWSPSTGLSATTGTTVVAQPTATTTYTVIGTSGAGCSDTTTVTVTVNALPIVDAGIDSSLCIGGSLTLNASGASTYSWTPSTGLSSTTTASPVANPTATSKYVLAGTDANGCVNYDSILVTVHPLPVVITSGNTSVCPGGTASLSAGGASTYSWTPATTLSCSNCSTPDATPAVTTTYVVTGTSAFGCVDTAQVTVSVNGTPTVTISGTSTICIGAGTTLTASGANSFSWSPSTGLSATSGSIVVAQPTTTTTYTVIGTSGAGCSDTTSVTVTVNPLPIVDAGSDTLICAGSYTYLNASGAVTWLWSPSGSLSSSTAASPVAGPTSTTTYVVRGTDANGCSNTDSVRVLVNPLPVVSGGSNTSVCPGGSATLNASGAVTYSWSPAATLSCSSCQSPFATPAATTIYTVTGTDINGCVNTAQVTVAVNATPTVTVTGNRSVCIGSSTTLTASGANSFTWSPATGLNTASGNTVTAQPTVTTTYKVVGTSGAGCADSTTVTITVNSLPVVNAGADTSLCVGTSVTLNASGANTYLWSPSGSLSASNFASPIASPSLTTKYVVAGTDANGCTNYDSVTVTAHALPIVTASGSASICPGGNTTLTAAGALTFSWSPSSGLSCSNCTSVVASPATTTTYVVTGASAAGCTDTAMVTVSVNSKPLVTVSGTLNICLGDTTVLNASGASSYTWSPSAGLSGTTGSSIQASPTATTNYQLVGSNGIGCTDTISFTVNVKPLPIVSAGPDTSVCIGSSVMLNANGAVSYTWSPALGLSSTTIANPTANPFVTTSYIVRGTDNSGCSNRDTVQVTVHQLPTVSAGANTFVCPGGSVTLNASGAQSYSWSPAASLSCASCPSPVATPTATTTYVLTGVSAQGCVDTAHVTITISPLPQINISGNRAICLGSSTSLTASGAANFVWSPATGLSCTTCPNPLASPATTTTYTVTGTSGAGCTAQDTITIVVNPLPVVTATDTQRSCLNVPVTLLASGAQTYSWTPASGLSCSNCPSTQATPAATTTYTVIGTDANGCKDTAQSTVVVLPLPKVVAGPDVYSCKFDSAKLSVSGAGSYTWSPASGLSCVTCDSPTAFATATTSYVVTGVDSNGCSASDTVRFIIYDQPPVNAGPDQTICAGQSANLQASGANAYTWTPDSYLSCTDCADPVSTPVSTISYVVHGTDLNGCRDSDQIMIRVIQHDSVSVDTGGAFCIGGSIQLFASGGDRYTWIPATGLSCTSCPDPVARPEVTTTYSVVIRQGSCFSDTLKTTVVVYPLPVINAGPDQSMVLGSSVKLQTRGSDIAHYSWTPSENLSCFDCDAPVASPAVHTTYVVTATSEHGCTASDDVRVLVRCDGSQVWLPNTFTPNADGQNDFFYPHGKGLSQITRFRIYDRWGELIFDRMNMPVNDRNSGWDGTYKNQTLKPDVYVWIVNATCTNGDPLELKGDISLIR